MKKIQAHIWLAEFYKQSDLFKPITTALTTLNPNKNRWPCLDEFRALLDSLPQEIQNHLNLPIQFVNQATACENFSGQYEPRIYLTGEVQTRLNNWHDFFQVLVWTTFPLSKVTLNSLHYHASIQRIEENCKNNQRTTTENFLTLFDEGGIIIVSHEEKYLEAIRQFQWPFLFWENRHAFDKNIECFTFGHAMFEKALNPYIGMTANAMLIHVDKSFFDFSYQQKLNRIDKMVADKLISEKHLSPKNLNPFPLLGVPNWHKENNTLEFYLNESYFRRGRRKKKPK